MVYKIVLPTLFHFWNCSPSRNRPVPCLRLLQLPTCPTCPTCPTSKWHCFTHVLPTSCPMGVPWIVPTWTMVGCWKPHPSLSVLVWRKAMSPAPWQEQFWCTEAVFFLCFVCGCVVCVWLCMYVYTYIYIYRYHIISSYNIIQHYIILYYII